MNPRAEASERLSGLALYLFDPDAVAAATEPAETSRRLVWILLELVRAREVSYGPFTAVWERDLKTFKRDLTKLCTIGVESGFVISRMRCETVRLEAIAGLPDGRTVATRAAATAIRTLAEGFGEVVRRDVATAFDLASAGDPFLRLAMPRPANAARVADTFAFVRDAWERRARVRFAYPSSEPSRAGTLEVREVEPYAAVHAAGRLYLVAFDRRPQTNAWRHFALDRMAGPLAVAGTFVPRTIPEAYVRCEGLGRFAGGIEVDVEVAVSPAIADAVFARVWQRDQRVERRPGAWSTLHLRVADLGEVVRWTLGFGTEARVVAPASAVALARSIVADLADSYQTVPPRDRSLSTGSC